MGSYCDLKIDHFSLTECKSRVPDELLSIFHERDRRAGLIRSTLPTPPMKNLDISMSIRFRRPQCANGWTLLVSLWLGPALNIRLN